MALWVPVIAASTWAIALGAGGGLLTEIGPWYRSLHKPAWQPPDWAFGPIWTLVLGLAAWAAVQGWQAAVSWEQHTAIVIVYAVNFVCHAAWSPLFFKLKRPDWALPESVFLWGSVVAMIYVLATIKPSTAYLLAPYIVWVTIAVVLNRSIILLNAPFRAAPKSTHQ